MRTKFYLYDNDTGRKHGTPPRPRDFNPCPSVRLWRRRSVSCGVSGLRGAAGAGPVAIAHCTHPSASLQ